MFVQSARFVSEHKKDPSRELSIHGHEKVGMNVALARMNLAMHGLEGEVREANSYYEDPFESTGRFDFVLANPPFNVNAVDKERLEADVGKGRRFPFGLPSADNANYLWIELFYSALNEKGRAGFVMANSASDARGSEMEIRKQLINSKAVGAMVAVGPNMFYTVTLPCTFGFLIKPSLALIARTLSCLSTRDIFIDKSIAHIATGRPHKSASSPTSSASIAAKNPISRSAAKKLGAKLVKKFSAKLKYADIAGLCKAAHAQGN